MTETILEKLTKRVPRKNWDEEAKLQYEVDRLLARIKRSVNKKGYRRSVKGGLTSLGAKGVILKDRCPFSRRVIVKASYLKCSGKNVRARLRHHFNYVSQVSSKEQRLSGKLYGAIESEIEFKSKLDDFEQSPHVFNIIISPEDGEKLELKSFVRNFINKVEVDLGTKLDWVAGNHYDTNDPHVHLLIKGQDDTGQKLFIKRDYISRGLRIRASEVATNRLGLRPFEEVVKSLSFDISKPKKCELDKMIVQGALQGSFDIEKINSKDLHELPKKLFTERLHYLKNHQIVEEQANGIWKISYDYLEKIEALSKTISILSHLSDKIKFDKQDCHVVSSNNLEKNALKGHVVERGFTQNDIYGEYLVIKSKDKQFYYLELEKYSEKVPAQVGEFVGIESTKPFEGPKASDKTIFQLSLKNRGVYNSLLHKEHLKDQNHLPPGVTVEDFISMHLKRLEHLAKKGLVTKLSSTKFEIPQKFLNNLELEAKKSQQNFTAHIKVIRLSPARFKEKSLNKRLGL